jgi:hypothetical protein
MRRVALTFVVLLIGVALPSALAGYFARSAAPPAPPDEWFVEVGPSTVEVAMRDLASHYPEIRP